MNSIWGDAHWICLSLDIDHISSWTKAISICFIFVCCRGEFWLAFFENCSSRPATHWIIFRSLFPICQFLKKSAIFLLKGSSDFFFFLNELFIHGCTLSSRTTGILSEKSSWIAVWMVLLRLRTLIETFLLLRDSKLPPSYLKFPSNHFVIMALHPILTYVFDWPYYTQCLTSFSSIDLLHLYAWFLILFHPP